MTAAGRTGVRIGTYGPDWTVGVLAEHLRPHDRVFVSDGEVVVDVGNDFVPVLCGELVELFTEDGRITGRCGSPVTTVDGYACDGHTRSYERALSEWELIELERREESER